MALTEKQMQHPQFWRLNKTAGDMLEEALKRHGMTLDDLDGLESHAGRVVDELTSLLLRASKRRFDD